MGPRAHSIYPFAANISGEHRAEAVPPKPHRLVTDPDAAFVQQVLEFCNDSGKRTHSITAAAPRAIRISSDKAAAGKPGAIQDC